MILKLTIANFNGIYGIILLRKLITYLTKLLSDKMFLNIKGYFIIIYNFIIEIIFLIYLALSDIIDML